MENINIKRVHWESQVKSITVACILLILLVEYIFIRDIMKEVEFLDVLVVLAIAVFTLFSIVKSPKCIVLTNSQLIIKKHLGERVLNINDIESVESYLPNRRDIRVIGSGGFLGYLGRYKNVKVGPYYSYVCDMNKAFFVTTKQGKNVMLSCEDRDAVVRAIRKELSTSK